MKTKTLLVLISLILLTACGGTQTEATPSPEPATPTLVPTLPDTPTPVPPNTPTPTTPPLPFDGFGQILFFSNSPIGIEVYQMNADGSERTRWAGQPEGLKDIVWSPDGSQAALVIGLGNSDDEIYIMNAEGSDLTQLTDNTADDWAPAWSPDGTQITFASQRDPIADFEGPPPEIYIMNADGSDQTRLTVNSVSDSCPAWSPDGTRIAYTSFSLVAYKSARINVVDVNSNEEILLVDTPLDEGCPVWSPDGSQMVFESRSVQGDLTQILVMDGEGGNLALLAEVPSTQLDPVWSPDGRWIMFSSDWENDEQGNNDLYVMSIENPQIINLTRTPLLDENNAVWLAFTAPPETVESPDGTAEAETPEPTDLALATATAPGEACTNQAEFVADVTIPDGTQFTPGEAFTKTWRIRNVGTCTWTSGYSLFFESGDQMGAPDFTPVTNATVTPGSTVDISVDMVAPNSEGTYRGVFHMQADDDFIFTAKGFWVEIEVVITQ